MGAAFPRRGIVPEGYRQGRQGKGDVHALGQCIRTRTHSGNKKKYCKSLIVVVRRRLEEWL
jgi:hypothetical protein